jgi:ubiquinone/menaquinone biosynthesis C-methylase UbiE
MTDAEVERIRRSYQARGGDADVYDARRADQVAIQAARARVWGAGLIRLGRRPGRVLEVGSGTGTVLRWALEIGASDALGVDLLPERLLSLRQRSPVVSPVLGDGRFLPLADRSVDTVICSTLFSSVLHGDVARAIAAEVDRVLRREGLVLWFDFFRDNPRNHDVRGVREPDIRALFSGYGGHFERVVLAPPVARRLVGRPRLAGLLEMVPPLRTHLAGVLVAPP